MTTAPLALAGIRRRRDAAVILADCALPYLAPRSFVIAASLDGADTSPYSAEVVFGPQDVIGGEGCRAEARIIGPVDGADPAAPLDSDVPGWATTPSGHAPLWLGCAGDVDAAAYASEAATLLTLVEAGSHGVRGFSGELPALGDTLVLEDGATATVAGIGYRSGHVREAYLTARLPNGEDVRGPLPADANLPWRPAEPAMPESTMEATPRPRRGRKRWS